MSFLERLANKVTYREVQFEMKDSGVEWIAQIPKNWQVKRLKNLFSFGKGLPITKADLVENGVSVISYGQIHAKSNTGTHLSKELLRFVPEIFLETNPSSLISKHDIIFADTSEDLDGLGNAVLMDIDGKVFAGYHTIILYPIDTRFSKYLAYLFLTDAWRSQLRASASGIKVFSVTQKMLRSCNVILPSPKECDIITSFLDTQCIKIDSIISEAKASIEEYKSWKASIIYEVVTKGLDPNVKMKDSGVEWIGEMPAHWRLIPFKYVLQERNERNTYVISKERLSLSIDLGVTLYADKTTNLDRFKEDFSQYKLAYAGDLVMNSMNMIVGASGVSSWFGCVSPAYYTFYDTIEDHVTAKFCEYIFRNKAMLRVLHGLGKGIYSIDRGDDRINTCRLKVSKDDLKKILIPIPPIEEQRKIVGYLKAKCTMLDTLVNEKQALITDLESHKKSLIFEVVTGKRRVV